MELQRCKCNPQKIMSFSRSVLTVSLQAPTLLLLLLTLCLACSNLSPSREFTFFRYIWPNIKWSLLYSLVPMDRVADTVWMGRVKGSHNSLSPHKNCPFLFHTQIYDHFHYIMSNYNGRYSLVYKISNSCKQLIHKGHTEQYHWLTYNQSGKSDFASSVLKNTRKDLSQL